MRASEHKRLKQNNKGFTLVELIASVAILAVVSAPIIHAFITSATNTQKARNAGEASMACQNVQETIKTCTIAEFCEFRDPADRMLTGTTLESTVADGSDRIVKLRNITAGGGKYDAKITFSEPTDTDASGTPQKLHAINAKDVVEYTDMTGVFSQNSTEASNPDIAADNLFKAENKGVPFDQTVTKDRNIIINASSVTANGIRKVYVDVVYEYTYTYAKNGAAYSYPIKMSFAVFPSGHAVEEGEVTSAYIMYFPNYTFDSAVKHTDIDEFVINNTGDEKMKFFIIKQAMAQNGKSMLTENPSILSVYEDGYLASISMKRTNIDMENDDSVYTNAGRNLVTGKDLPDGHLSYQIITGMWSTPSESKITGDIVSHSPMTRIWNVNIQIFKEGTAFAAGEEPLYEYTGTKLTD